MILAYVGALTPSLATRIGLQDSFSLNLSGQSSTGKTTALLLAQALTTGSSERDLFNLNATVNEILQRLPSYGGMAVPCTDLKVANEKGKAIVDKLQTLVFTAGSGSGRERLGEAPAISSAYCVPMLSSEKPIGRIFDESGLAFQTGDAVRLIDVPVAHPNQGGIFSRMREGDDSKRLVRDLRELLERQHGTVLPGWIKLLAGNSPGRISSKVEKLRAEFISSVDAPEGYQSRIAVQFSLMFATGAIAVGTKRLPLKVSTIKAAFRRLYNSAISLINERAGRAAEAWERLHAVTEDDAFPLIKKATPVVNASSCVRGFRRKEGEDLFLYVKHRELKAIVGDDWSFAQVIMPKLKEAGVLAGGHTASTVVVRQAGLPGKSRYLRLDLDKLDRLNGHWV